MILCINTIDRTTEIKLFNRNATLLDGMSFDGSFVLSEKLVQKIDSLLENNNFSKKDLTQVAVNIGPGSYTGVRIGVTTANCIAFSLNIPILKFKDCEGVEKAILAMNSQKIFTSPVLPVYDRSPHITKKK